MTKLLVLGVPLVGLLAVTTPALPGCGGCHDVDFSAIRLAPASECVHFDVPASVDGVCGVAPGPTFTGQNDCAVAITWPASASATGAPVVIARGRPILIEGAESLSVEGDQQVVFQLGEVATTASHHVTWDP